MIKKDSKIKKEAPAKPAHKEEKSADFSGKYIQAIGRRKTAIAQVRLYEAGAGFFLVNGKELKKYFNEAKAGIAMQPIEAAGLAKSAGASIIVRGGGINSQAEAIRHGLSRALLLLDKELEGMIRAKGWLTRDSRKVERKKPGLKKARRAPQWSKR
jgi:small subunit ribosomal protein S9